jgi:hypothetical protein
MSMNPPVSPPRLEPPGIAGITASITGITASIAVILPFSGPCRRNIAGDPCEIWGALRGVIRPRLEGFPAMTRSPGAAGFNGRSAPVASSRLIDAVAASLAIGSLSLCLIVALTVLSIKVSMAMPIPM